MAVLTAREASSDVERAIAAWRGGGNHDFVRFIVLGDARSGSTWFMDLLRSHPQIVSYDELFHRHAIYGSRESSIFSSDDHELARREADPARYLDEIVFSPKRASVRAVGFKVFYSQLWRGTNRFRLPRALAADSKLRVISLVRRDLLAALTSRARAWGKQKGQERCYLSPSYCLMMFLRYETQRRVSERYFAGHPFLRVDYEQLCRDQSVTTASVLHHLDCEPRPLSSSISRTRRAPLSEVITNYGQLQRFFRWTPWGHLFP